MSVLRCPQPDVLDVQLLPATGELDLDGISGGGVGEQGRLRPEARLERARGCSGCGQGAQCGVWQRALGPEADLERQRRRSHAPTPRLYFTPSLHLYLSMAPTSTGLKQKREPVSPHGPKQSSAAMTWSRLGLGLGFGFGLGLGLGLGLGR